MSAALKQMTVDEFLLWAEGKEGRWELHDGVPVMMSDAPVAMSPERLGHTRTKGIVFVALADGLKQKGLPCEAFIDGLAIEIDARTTFEPDASVVCGPRRPDDTIVVSDPIIVVEVLSPEHRRDRPRPQAQRLLLAGERRALSHSRSRSPRRDPPQARAGRCNRDAGADVRRCSPRSAGVRGRGRGAVSCPVDDRAIVKSCK